MPLDIEYRLLWQKDLEQRPPLSWVMQTRRRVDVMRKPDETFEWVVDFEGPALKKLAAGEKAEAVITVDDNGKVLETNAFPNEAIGGWRMTIRLQRLDKRKSVEMRAYLRSKTTTLSETWSHILPPE